MNFLQLCQYVADHTDNTRPSTVYNADLGMLSRYVRRIRDHVNDSFNMIKLAFGHRNESAETTGTITTVAGTESYNFPSGMFVIQQLKFSTDPPMRILPWPEFERWKSDTLTVTVLGSPEVACIYQRKIFFYPTPDSVYSIDVRGLETLTELSLDADTPDLPTEFHKAIAALALHFEMVYENNPQAGVLVVSENGDLMGQGGQAAKAVSMFKVAKKNFRSHMEEPPRIVSRTEQRRLTALRRIIRA